MGLEKERMVLYRGSLKSCNYDCSYCPFSKHPRLERELLKDKEQWFRFCDSLIDRAKQLRIGGMMVVPYGEALIHPWYWEGMGRLVGTGGMDAVGAQTNLSFSLRQSLAIYEGAGGKKDKLRLWATFHPQMTTAEEFAEKCRQIYETGVMVCAGAVGVPENIRIIRHLRKELPKEIYLWINKMDGLTRKYTRQETAEFRAVDPYFGRELEYPVAFPAACTDRLFVEGNGTLRRCNISSPLSGNWYGIWENVFDEETKGREKTNICGRKRCSCYLSYGGRAEVMNRILFGVYPLFRIPRRPKAVFLDIDGLLIAKTESRISGRTITDIRALAADGCRLFFATALPFRDAKRKCTEIWDLFQGGIFAAGAHVLLQSEKEKKEQFAFLESSLITVLEQEKAKWHFRMLVYGDEDRKKIGKITLVRPRHMGWKEKEAESLKDICEKAIKAGRAAGIQTGKESGIRCFAEENCLQIVAANADKAAGVRLICDWIGILPEEACAAGDSQEDMGMIELCSHSVLSLSNDTAHSGPPLS